MFGHYTYVHVYMSHPHGASVGTTRSLSDLGINLKLNLLRLAIETARNKASSMV